MTPWTSIDDTAIWRHAKAAYARPEGRHYHGFAHVERLYEIAAEKRLPYDMALDLAILTHDVIYDDKPEKERRSADWLLDFAPHPGCETWAKAEALVMSTVDHRPGGDDRLAMLDIHDFVDFERSLRNRELLVCEFAELQGLDRETFIAGNIGFLSGLAARIEGELGAASAETRNEWAAIAKGIRALADHEPVGRPDLLEIAP